MEHAKVKFTKCRKQNLDF